MNHTGVQQKKFKKNTYMMIYDRFAVESDQLCAVSEGNKNMSWNYPHVVDWFTSPTVCHIFKKLKRKNEE